MVKHIKTIRRQKLTNCLSVFEHCVGLTLKGLTQLPQKRRNNFGKKGFLSQSKGNQPRNYFNNVSVIREKSI